MGKDWTVTHEMSTIRLTQVFSGGACNVLDANSKLLRNSERDAINDWLTEKKIFFYDPQIHPDTHGEEYDYDKHSVLEVIARQAAKVYLYEISPLTFGGITSLEIAADHILAKEPTVIYYSDGETTRDQIPVHSRKGDPLFQPRGLRDSRESMRAHYKEFRKNGNHLRRYIMQFARDMETLTVTFGKSQRVGDLIIAPDRMHAADLFTAVVKAARGERIFINFSDADDTRDEDGNPLFTIPKQPRVVSLDAFLDQYVDEGNALRRAIASLININVFTRVVYTQKSAILGVSELMQMTGVL